MTNWYTYKWLHESDLRLISGGPHLLCFTSLHSVLSLITLFFLQSLLNTFTQFYSPFHYVLSSLHSLLPSPHSTLPFFHCFYFFSLCFVTQTLFYLHSLWSPFLHIIKSHPEILIHLTIPTSSYQRNIILLILILIIYH